MKRLSSAGASGITRGLLLSLAAVSLAASAVTPKTVSAPSGGSPRAALSVAAQEPVSRLIIRYRSGVKAAGQVGATPATERAEAATQVARTAHVAGAAGLRYLKSVSSSLHVAALEQPVSPEQAQALMQRLRADAAVEDVVIDRRVKPHFTPSDPFFTGGDQWHLQAPSLVPGGINAAAAWDSSTGVGVVVAVLDGGYRPHVDLAANVLAGFDFVSADKATQFGGDLYWTANDGDARDADATDPGDWVSDADAAAGYCDTATNSTWHGTHVAGLAGAVGNNGEGGLGVAFGAKILPVRVLGRCGGYVSDIQAGARWAAGLAVPDVPVNTTPARVLNLSLGLPGTCDSITQGVIDEVLARNVAIVASAGNDYATSISAPANCAGVIAVTAHTREGDNADYANVGTGVALSAPGGGDNTILRPQPGIPREIVSTGNAGTTVPAADNYLLLRGTSMAAPQVAGVLALLASLRPDLPMATLKDIVVQSARPFPAGSYCATNPDALPAGFCGSGMLDAQAAVAAAATAVAPVPASDSGGGCTVASNGQADAGLLLLVLAALLVLGMRRRQRR